LWFAEGVGQEVLVVRVSEVVVAEAGAGDVVSGALKRSEKLIVETLREVKHGNVPGN
jgi:hypothetical protein